MDISENLEVIANFSFFPENILLKGFQVAAGFPSPAEDFLDRAINLDEQLIQNPTSTFLIRVKGNSMQDANIFSGDVLIVDRSLTANDLQIIIAVVNGDFTVKRLNKTKNGIQLLPENSAYPPIFINDSMEFMVWGVVTYIIHKAR